ncbi:ribonuclease H-like domain-containing protein [Rhodotorula toruloides]
MNGFVRFLHPDLARLSAPWDSQAVRVRYALPSMHILRLLTHTLTDLEWSPFIRPGVQGTTALIQICDRQSVLLVHLAQMNYQLPDVLRRFIEDEEVIKLGVHINGDVHKLRRDFDVSPRGCVEISDLHRRYGGVGTAGGRLISLQRLVGHYLESYLPKDEDVRMGRWSHALSPAQIHYAANDVYASLMVVERAAEAAGRTAGQLAQDLAALAS